MSADGDRPGTLATTRRTFLALLAAAVMPLPQVEPLQRRGPSQRLVGLAGLFRRFVDEATQQALAAGFTQQPARALSAWDPLTPGAWLRERGASPAAAELITLGYGTDFGSAASFLLHGLNSRGAAISY